MNDEPVELGENTISVSQSYDPKGTSPIPPVVEDICNQTDGSPEAIKKYFQTISFEEFSSKLNQLNGFYRNTYDQNSMDGYGKTGDGYMPPAPEDRKSLLKEAFEKAMTENSAKSCGLVLGMSILTIHPYLDGNGRTSRAIFALLVNGYSGSEKDRALFTEIGDQDDSEESHRSSHDIIDLDPGSCKLEGGFSLADVIGWDMKKAALINRFGDNIDIKSFPTQVGGGRTYSFKYNPKLELNEETQFELNSMFTSIDTAFVACINSFPIELYEKSLRHISFGQKEYDIVDYNNVIENITSEDLSNLRFAFKQARIDYVREIMNVTKRDDFLEILNQYTTEFEMWKKQNQN